jgi:hypothetical protein
MDKPWWIDVLMDLLIIGIAIAWMGWTFGTMQQHGPSLALLVPALAMGMFAILVAYGLRVRYLRIGNWLEIGGTYRSDETEEVEEWRQRNR